MSKRDEPRSSSSLLVAEKMQVGAVAVDGSFTCAKYQDWCQVPGAFATDKTMQMA